MMAVAQFLALIIVFAYLAVMGLAALGFIDRHWRIQSENLKRSGRRQ